MLMWSKAEQDRCDREADDKAWISGGASYHAVSAYGSERVPTDDEFRRYSLRLTGGGMEDA